MSLSLMLKHTVLGRILMLLGIGAIFVLIFEFWAFSYKTRIDAANENNQQITQSINALRADIVSRNALYNRLTEHDMFWIKQHFSGVWQVQPDSQNSSNAELLFNGSPVAEQQIYLDRFSSNGSSAGILVRNGDLFSFALRSDKEKSHNILDKDNPATAELLAGKPYHGIFYTAGNWRYGFFEPIKNANGVVIGAIYSGIDITADIQQFIRHMSTIKIGQHGYVAIVNVNKGASFGLPVFHPLLTSASAILAEKDVTTGQSVLTTMLAQQKGNFDYTPNAQSGLQHAYFEVYTPWGWLLNVVMPEQDMQQLIVKNALFSIGSMLIGTVFMGLFGCIVLIRNLLPLQTISASLSAIAAGDMTTDLTVPKQNTEIRRLALESKMMQQKLRDMIHSIQSSAREVKHEVVLLATETEHMGNSAHVMEEQTTRLTSIARELQSTTQTVQQYCADSKLQMGVIHDHVHSGVMVIANAEENIMAINSRMQEVVNSSSQVQRATDDIVNLVNAIQQIANQTNLLALNAAIEAARAGEHGRGFAVVADEVRNLSIKVSETLSEVTQVVDSIRVASQQATNFSHKTAEQISLIEKQDMRQVEEQFEAIIFAQDEMAQRIEKIVDSMILQREVADNITNAANETHVVSEQTSRAAQTMNTLSESTSQISEQLVEAVNGFKV